MRIETDIKLDFCDVLIRPKRSELQTRSEVSLERSFYFRQGKVTWQGIPIIAANMDHTGTFAMASALANDHLLTALDKFLTLDEWRQFAKAHPNLLPYCLISTGIVESDLIKLQQITQEIPLTAICLDVANGYTERFVSTLQQLRLTYANLVIMAGNVVTGEMVEEFILAGADIVKIGIGPGSVCTTRLKTGVGYPQLSAIIECADAAHGLGGYVCADGGCLSPGDVAKAFAAGADFVMLGGMFAGHDECSGQVFEKRGRQLKHFYGMSSTEAIERHYGEMASYRASEGRSVNVPYRGPIQQTVADLLGSLRSTCTYVGAHQLKELPKRATFIRVRQQTNHCFASHDTTTCLSSDVVESEQYTNPL